MADFVDHFEDEPEGLVLHCGDAGEGCVMEEKELSAKVVSRLFEPFVFREMRVKEVPFVGDDEARFVFLLDGARDFTIHGGHSGVEVDD